MLTPPKLCFISVATVVALAVAGCRGEGPQVPATVTGSSDVPHAELASQQSTEFLAASYQLTISDAGATVELTPSTPRSAAKQGDIFDLDANQFVTPDTFTIQGLAKNPEGDLVITFRHSHPNPAPNFALPASAANRADLGYAGKLVILADEEAQSFFGGTVTLDPGTVVSADGYIPVGPLLANTAVSNDTFPFVLLTDESEDNRVGVSNGGNLTGNYNPVSGGWTQANAGVTSAGLAWTGYDFVNQGQTIENDFTLSAERLSAGPFTIELALVVKYTEPKGGATGAERRSNRLPPVVPDFTKFAYRLPHAASDSSVTLQGGVEVTALASRCGDALFLYRDWDSLGIEGTDDDVSDESNLAAIVPGTRAVPTGELDAPDLAASPSEVVLGDYGEGLPSSEIPLLSKVTNELLPAVGEYVGLLRLVTPELGLDDTYHFGLDPDTFGTGRPPLHEVYQVIPITVVPPDPDEPSEPPGIISQPCDSGGQPLGVEGWQAPSGTNNPTSWLWDFGTGATPLVPTDQNPTVVYGSQAGIFTGSVIATNAFGSSPPHYFRYIVSNPGAPLEPYGGPRSLLVVGPETAVPSGNGALTLAVDSYDDPSPGTLTIEFDWNRDGIFAGIPEQPQPVSGPAPVVFISPAGFNNPFTYERVFNVPYRYTYSVDVVPVIRTVPFRVGPNQRPVLGGNLALVDQQVPTPALFTIAQGSAAFMDPENDPITFVVTNNRNGDTPSGPAFPVAGNTSPLAYPPTNDVTFTVRASTPQYPGLAAPPFPPVTGQVLFVPLAFYGAAGVDSDSTVVVHTNGEFVVTGYFNGTVNFGGGNRVATGLGSSFIASYNADATWDWDLQFSSVGVPAVTFNRVFLTSGGDLRLSGGFTGNTNFGGGLRTVAGAADCFALAIQRDGTYQWDQVVASPGNDGSVWIAVTPSDQTVLGGHYGAAFNFGGGVRANNGGQDAFVVLYSPAGTYIWDRTFGAAGTDHTYSVTADSAGNVYAGGRVSAGANPGGGASVAGIFFSKYSNSNVFQWDNTVTFSGASADVHDMVAMPGTDDLAAAGIYDGTINFGGGLRTAPGGTADLFVVQYSSALGTYIDDAAQFGSGLFVAELDVDPASNLYLSGYATASWNFGGNPHTTLGMQDLFVVKFDPTLTRAWDWTAGGVGTDIATGLWFDGDGHLFVSGWITGVVDMNPGGGVTNSPNFGLQDIFRSRLDAATGLF